VVARSSRKKPQKQAPGAGQPMLRTPWLEWVASALGLVIVLAIVILLARELIQASGAPPVLRVDARAVSAHAGGFTVEILAKNESGATAAQVEIEGVLKRGAESVETARATLDFVPGHSVRGAGLFFTRDPRQFELQVRALGYARP
jgi:uncharacterized protein (TIGR02588 family)